MTVLGVGSDTRFTTFSGRTENRNELEALMVAWCAQRTRDEVVATLAKADAAVGPVFDMADIATDEHYAARHMIETVGTTPMQGLIASLSRTPGVLRWEGRALDADHEDIANNGWGTTS
jgi:crotonobetainyl-CoA:carnitine CoA-transferase CaiB-like acyl-CoA transferase